MDLKADDAVIGERGLPEIEKVRPLIYVPETGDYFSVGRHVGKAFSIGRTVGR
jgi:hypothetical protein